MVLAHLFVAAILVMYTYLYSPTVCFVPLLKYFIKKPPCTKPIPQNIWPKTNGETNLEMQNYFDAGNGLIIHDDKKDTGNNSDNQRQKCVLAYFYLFKSKFMSFSRTASPNESRADTLRKYAIFIPYYSLFTLKS